MRSEHFDHDFGWCNYFTYQIELSCHFGLLRKMNKVITAFSIFSNPWSLFYFVPVGSRLSLGPITPSRKKQQITETLISQLNECYVGSSTTTCQTPDGEFIRWDDGGMTGAHPIWKEACTLIKSFANPKKMLRIGNWNVRTMNCSWRSGKMKGYLTTGDVGWSFVSLRREISWNVEIGEE